MNRMTKMLAKLVMNQPKRTQKKEGKQEKKGDAESTSKQPKKKK